MSGHTELPWEVETPTDLVKALEDIEGGYFDGASALVASGDWKAFTEHLQALARAALATLTARKVG